MNEQRRIDADITSTTQQHNHIMRIIIGILLLIHVQSRVLTICTKPAPPFSIKDESSEKGWVGFSWDYFSQELLPSLKESTNVEDFTILDCEDNTESLRRVGLGTVDLAHSAITKTSLREDVVDFTNTWFVSGLRVLVRTNNDFIQTLGRIMGTLGTALGLFMSVLVVLTLGGSMILSVAEMSAPGPIEAWDTDTYLSNLLGAMTVIQNTLLPGSGSIIEPYGFYSKIVLSGFKSFGAVLPPILTALITMVLIINNSSNVIQGVGDLPGHSVIVPVGTTSEAFVRSYSGIQIISVPDVETMFVRYAAGEGDALIYDWPVLNSFINTQKQIGSSVSYELVGNVFEEQQYGIAVSNHIINSTNILEGLNKAILETWKTPRFNLLEEKWIDNKAITLSTQVQNSNNQLIALLITGSFVLGLGVIVTVVWAVYKCCMGTSTEVQSSADGSLAAKANVIKTTLERQQSYARRLPPNTLTYANWEMLSAIANFLKEWHPA
jgi:ABC-type amino acid transport substrate-binding protein